MTIMNRFLTITTLLGASIAVSNAQTAPPLEAFINEFHYRNQGPDQHIGIEIVGPKDADASPYTLIRYQGRDGNTFLEPVSLAGEEIFSGIEGPPAAASEFGFVEITWLNPQGMIRKGKEGGDGLCLVKNDTDGPKILQFISYGGAFQATNGPCLGGNSTDIGVQEVAGSDPEKSLQLGGAGRYVGDFEWKPPAQRTPGAVNFNQTFLTAAEWLAVQT